jgi:hypothetical protein
MTGIGTYPIMNGEANLRFDGSELYVNGDVGIGTSATTHKLHLYDTSDCDFYIEEVKAGTTAANLIFRKADGALGNVSTNDWLGNIAFTGYYTAAGGYSTAAQIGS